jgi:LPS-assembly lipoprotein
MFLHRREKKEFPLMHTTGLNRRALLAAAAASLALTGCGFRPRGRFTVPFETVYLQMSDQSTLKWELRRHINAETNARVVDQMADADAILSIVSQSRSRMVQTYNDIGDAREYRLGWDVTFKLAAPDGYEYLPPTTLSARRDLPYTIRNYLSRETEEATLYRDIERDIVVQLMRRIEAAKAKAHAAAK